MLANVSAACKQCVKITGSTLPDPAQVEKYVQGYAFYRDLYPLLKSTFPRL